MMFILKIFESDFTFMVYLNGAMVNMSVSHADDSGFDSWKEQDPLLGQISQC